MRFFFVPMLLLAVCIHSFGQQGMTDSKEEKRTRAAGQAPLLLFQKANDQKPAADWPALADHTVLQIQPHQLATLYAAAPDRLLLEIPERNGGVTVLALERSYPTAAGLSVELRHGGRWTGVVDGLHYRGRIFADETSVAAISLFPDEVYGLWSSEARGGNWLLGRLPGAGADPIYLSYLDKGLVFNPAFACAVPNDGKAYEMTDLQAAPRGKQKGNPCIDLFWEVDYDVFVDKGGTEKTVRYLTSLFNQLAAVFDRDGIALQLARLYIWNAPSVYNGASVERQLRQFQENRTRWDGDLAQLLSYKVNGGIAASFDGLCGDTLAKGMSYAGISSVFSSIPNYSWTLNVIAHELGHLLGARHTHACVWNGDGTSIDDCGNVYVDKRGGEPEGQACFTADRPRYPQQGGTLMSYCHLLDGVGINLSKGFHEQPLSVIWNKVARATCLESCTPAAIVPECVGNEVTLALTLDDFGSETTWQLRDQYGWVLYAGGPYPDGRGGERIEETLCLGPGCFTLEMYDASADGMCCYYGQGGYALSDTSGLLLGSGGRFGDAQKITFCLPVEEPSTSGRDNCQRINFHETPLDPYGGTQDAGAYEIRDDGAAIRLWGNAWKSIPLEYKITPFTILEFDFGSTAQAEIHAIGLDNDREVSFNRTFKLFGTQNWGILPYFNYEYPGEWMSFSIPVGLHYEGPVERLFLCVDDDEAPVDGDSWFRNIRLYESGECQGEPASEAGRQLTGATTGFDVQVFPNPAREQVNILLAAPGMQSADLQLISTTGRVLRRKIVLLTGTETRERLEVGALPPGTYFLRVITGGEMRLEKIVFF